MTLLALTDVSKAYLGGEIAALHGISLSLAERQTMAVMGPSGCGKSTLLNIATGLERPTSGSVRFDGEVVRERAAWGRLRAEAIGIVFQGFHLLPALTAVENVEIPMVGRVRSGRTRRARAMAMLERVAMSYRAAQLPGTLSGGEQQRVAIARALINGPRLLVADEPTGNLDDATGEEIATLLLDLSGRHGMALLIVTHNAQLAARLGVRVFLRDGRLVRSCGPCSPAATAAGAPA